jgi:hypothetical protein
MIIVRMKGITLQVISNLREPSMGLGLSYSERRRYFIAKYTTSSVISIEKKMLIPTRKRYRASTSPATVEARSGNKGKFDHIF